MKMQDVSLNRFSVLQRTRMLYDIVIALSLVVEVSSRLVTDRSLATDFLHLDTVTMVIITAFYL